MDSGEPTAEEKRAARRARRGAVPAAPLGHILVVDDGEDNRNVLVRRLSRDGYTTVCADNGRRALEVLGSTKVDVVLLDIMMPEMDGFETLAHIKAHDEWKHLPVIMISAMTEIDAIVRCIESGAEDYLHKPFEPPLLRARISASLERKRLREKEQEHLRALKEAQERLEAEMNEAVVYVTSLLPPPLAEGGVHMDWRFVPSTYLGGDALGYEALPDRGGVTAWAHPGRRSDLAFFVLDVCGHGVGAALLAAAATNVLRARTLRVDYGDPAALLRALNDAFPMERHHDMYFSLWYGVYFAEERRLVYASGGHPPALLVPPGGDLASVQRLRTPGLAIGSMPGAEYETASVYVPPASTLWVFSDGAFEVTRPDGSMMELDDFVSLAVEPPQDGVLELDRVLGRLTALRGAERFEDDLSLLHARFE